jgi:hypothetical protein
MPPAPNGGILQRRLIAAGPDCNLAVATGGWGFVLEDDGPGARDWLRAMEERHGPLPNTWAVSTSPGRGHRYFLSKAPVPNVPKDKLAPDVEIKGLGGYVVCPPSIHPDGHPYKFVVGPEQMDRPAEAPAWLVELALAHQGAKANGHGPAPAVGAVIVDGQRNRTLTSLAGTMRRPGMSEPAIVAALLEENAARCSPPLDDEEVRTIARSVMRYPPTNDGELRHGNQPGAVPITGPNTVGTRTLGDLPTGPPRPQLVPPFLTPEGVTIIYGPGGVGKGFVALHLTLQLVRRNMRVTLVDFETHPGEWGRRAVAMGFTDADLLMVNYRAPFDTTDWMAPRGSLAQIADVLRPDLDNPERRADYLVIDSYTTATSTGDAMGGMAAAQEFFAGISKLGRPVLVIAHVAAGQEKFPPKPFGSIFVHNLARETWAAEQMGSDPDVAAMGPMAIELRNRKANGQARQGPQFFTFTFADDGAIDVGRQEPAGRTVTDMIEGVLGRSLKHIPVPAIRSLLRTDEGKTVSAENVRTILQRNPRRFRKYETSPITWGLCDLE